MTKPPKHSVQSLVVYAKSKGRVSLFYERTLELSAVEATSSHTLLRGRGIEIVIHAIPRKYAAHIKVEKPPQLREDTPLKPVFFVKNLEAVRTAARDTGGALKPMTAAWRYNGSIVLDGNDPEGNVVQFRQDDA
jgi:hypothetical protein